MLGSSGCAPAIMRAGREKALSERESSTQSRASQPAMAELAQSYDIRHNGGEDNSGRVCVRGTDI